MTVIHFDSIVPLFNNMWDDLQMIPWHCVGVFPTEDSAGPPEAWWNSFVYTVGFMPGLDLWMPCTSIEGRYMGPQLTTSVLNIIATGVREGLVNYHDDVIVPLGVPDGSDVDCIVWVGPGAQPGWYRQANFSDSDVVIPMVWTSGLGWRDDD